MTRNRNVMIFAAVVALAGLGWYGLRSRSPAAPNPPAPGEPVAQGTVENVPPTNVYALTASDDGATVVYPLTSRFTVTLDGGVYPKNGLSCSPQGILGGLSDAGAAPSAGRYSVRFEAVKTGSCTLRNGDFDVTIQVADASGEAWVAAPAHRVIRAYYDALNGDRPAVARMYLGKDLAAQLPVDRLAQATDALRSIVVTKTSPWDSPESDRERYETFFEVALEPGGLSSFQAGGNIRVIELIRENGAWKISKIALRPENP